ncbi:zinc-binding domain-containing protein [Trichoderma sp. SZMC 28014]
MTRNKPKSSKRWAMYPSLHENVSLQLEKDNLRLEFYANDEEESCVRDYDTNITGRFKCHNNKCDSNGWSSMKIAITIRMYPNDRYNARVYYQRCKGCNRLSKPLLDDTYAERVAYRIKKWHGIQLETPPYSEQSNRPHKSALCEGCKDGHCKEMKEGFLL